MKVEWKKDYYKFKADPEKVYEELEPLGDQVKPEDIVQAAQDESSELHKCFTWDDTEAADKWRQQEARQIMRCLVYTNDDPEVIEEPEPIRVFYNVGKRDKPHYEPVTRIVKDQDKYQELLSEAWAELGRIKKKYSMLTELKEIFALIA